MAVYRTTAKLALLDLSRFFGHRRWIRQTPGVFFFAGPETGEITTTCGTAVRRSAATKHDQGPTRRVIILLAPGGQFLTVAARAAREFPSSSGPNASTPTTSASEAAERIDPEEGADLFRKILFMRNPHIASPALWTRKLHNSETGNECPVKIIARSSSSD